MANEKETKREKRRRKKNSEYKLEIYFRTFTKFHFILL